MAFLPIPVLVWKVCFEFIQIVLHRRHLSKVLVFLIFVVIPDLLGQKPAVVFLFMDQDSL
jgi:hypothetical protein